MSNDFKLDTISAPQIADACNVAAADQEHLPKVKLDPGTIPLELMERIRATAMYEENKGVKLGV